MSTKYNEAIREIIPDVEFHQNVYARRLSKVVGPDVRWLDVGAGSRIHNGYGVATPLQLARSCKEVVGIDFEARHLEVNEALTSFSVGGADALPYDDGRFEMVSANMVLEHLEKPRQVFREISRVLAPGGRFVFVTPNLNHPLVRGMSLLLTASIQRQVAHRVEGRQLEHIFPTFYRANTTNRIRDLAMESSLEVEDLEVFRNIPFLTRPSFAVRLECHFIAMCRHSRLQGLGADIIGVLRKPLT
jgi:ubiquinone/menaquinone biosynthesis C-methylase UbiE